MAETDTLPLLHALDEIEPTDQWAIPLLVATASEHPNELAALRAVSRLWTLFPSKASRLSGEIFGNASPKVQKELALEMSCAGALTADSKTLLDVLCGKAPPRSWGFILTDGPRAVEETVVGDYRSERNAAFARVAYVCENSPAARAGIGAGDVIRAINGRRLLGVDVRRALSDSQQVKLTIQRAGANKELTMSR
jgi:membrane-associated protease RseP (regulator of RpoE activity)